MASEPLAAEQLPPFRAYFAMPLYVRDWLASRAVRTMTSEQRGGFLMLLLDAWPTSEENLENPCTVPDDDGELAVLSGMGAERWAAAGAKVRAQFEPAGPGRLRNAKQWAVYTELIQQSHKKSLAGQKGMASRYGRLGKEHEDNTPPNTTDNTATTDTEQGAEYPPEFEAAWKDYPKRKGGNAKKAAHRAWRARLIKGVTAEELHEAVRGYAAHIRETGKEGTEFVMQGSTFLGPDEKWKDYVGAASVATARDRAAERWALYKHEGMTSTAHDEAWWSSAIAGVVGRGLAPSAEAFRVELRAVRPWDIAKKAQSTEWAITEVAKRLAEVPA